MEADMEAVTDLRIQADDKSFDFLLCNVTISENLTTLRDRVRKLLKGEKYRQISSFNFTMRNAPISSRQENILNLSRIAQKDHEGKLVIYVKAVYDNGDDRGSEETMSKTKQEKLDYVCRPNEQVITSSRPSPRQSQKEVSETVYRVYSDADIKSSEGLEKKKRLYWNDRISEFSEDIKYNRISKFEAYGIIDVEWTRKQTELLRVMVDEAILTLQEKNLDPTSTLRKSTNYEADVEKAYERLDQSDFKLKYSYRRIEDLHKTNDSEQIKREEENFDKLYSDLKCQQANLTKCLKAFQERQLSDADSSTSSICSHNIQEYEIQGLVEGIKYDYRIDDIPPDSPEAEEPEKMKMEYL